MKRLFASLLSIVIFSIVTISNVSISTDRLDTVEETTSIIEISPALNTTVSTAVSTIATTSIETTTFTATTTTTDEITISETTTTCTEIIVEETIGETVTEVVQPINETEIQEDNPVNTDYDILESEILALAKLCAGEAGHLPDDEHRFVIWTVFNRVDEGRWGGTTIESVINEPYQFVGKGGDNNWTNGTTEYKEHIMSLVREEYIKWLNDECCPTCTYTYSENAEHGYNSFTGDGSHNWFTKN